MSLDWTSSTETRDNPSYADQPWLQRPGEVFGEPRPYSPRPTPIGLDYAHFCGTEEEFGLGVTYDPDRVVDYDEQGLPLCCRGPIVPVFDLVLEFSVEFDATPTPTGDCATAPELELGRWYYWTIEAPASGAIVLWRFDDVIAGNQYRLRAEQVGGPLPIGETARGPFFQGLPCVDMVPPAFAEWGHGLAFNLDTIRTLGASPHIVAGLTSPTFITVDFTFRFRVDPA